ncbi:kininogen-1-like [Pristis pectinata]|uniref:kininogen-1-like n=1 Tax=Pristis pectinata TaxID=685728 RepID=UPI00223D763C|nr:kininogen-1-like [Pristis pectinata]
MFSMKLLYIPLFIIQFLNINADSEPVATEDQQVQKVDCNDTGVLAAVDFTLRKFNAEQGAGNKFALYRVIDAEVQGEVRIKYFVTFTIYETDCPIESEKVWKDCDYKEPKKALSAECTSDVVINRIQRINEVTLYNCTPPDHHSWIFPKKAPCLGCERLLPINHPIVNKTSVHAIKIFNSDSTYDNYFRIATIYNLTHQVVAGIKYQMRFLNQETECSKDQPLDYESITSCPFKAEGTKLHCVSTLVEQVWINYTTASVSCHPEAPEAVLFGYGGWGPFLARRPQEGTEEGLHSSSETPESAEVHDLSTCPGRPWKPLHQVKPALPPVEDHHDSQGQTTVT